MHLGAKTPLSLLFGCTTLTSAYALGEAFVHRLVSKKYFKWIY
jgi:hypothetical protein